MSPPSILVVLSGGQDSATTALMMALRHPTAALHAISFDYGQRHRRELEAARQISTSLQFATHHFVRIEGLQGGALTNEHTPVKESGGFGGLPSTFLPGRNVVFLSMAAARAAEISRTHPQGQLPPIVTGVCETDFSGYPDCREETIESLENTLRLALGGVPVVIQTPLMRLTKAQTVLEALKHPRGLEILGMTWTCYNGLRFHCGRCPACVLRLRGFQEAGVADPVEYFT